MSARRQEGISQVPFFRPGVSAIRIAGTVAAVYVAAGLGWVFLSDVALYRFIADPVLISRVETAKGWIFVLVSGLLIFGVAFASSLELERTQRLASTVIQSIGDGVLLLGADRKIAHANPAALRMLHSELRDLVGMDAGAFSQRFRVSYPSGGVVAPEHFVSQRVFDEAGPLHYKALLHVPGERELVIWATAAGVRTDQDNPADWVVSVMHDITHSERLDQLRNRFFAAAAHCLKTPVATTKAHAQVLVQKLPPEHRGAATAIERQCDRIDRVVQNLLVLARVRSGTFELHPTDLELGPMIERIAAESVWSHHHHVRTEIDGATKVYADPERLALAIRNLVYEASRLSPAMSPITIAAGSAGSRVAVGITYHPVDAWADVSWVYEEYDDIGIARMVTDTIITAHAGSLERSVNSPFMTRIELPGPLLEQSHGSS